MSRKESTAVVTQEKPTPFVKWVGGKRAIIHELMDRMPKEFHNYYEAFVGGGALFYNMGHRANACFLSDINPDLVNTYNVIKNDVDSLVEVLQVHKEQHSKDYYYEIRSQHHLDDPIAVAARFIYLNKTCFNGLYRVNKKGEFNVPMGRYKNPGILQEANLRAVSAVLQHTSIQLNEFDQIEPQAGDFVYFDPPYHPIDANSFTTYTKNDFSEQDQIRLRDFALELSNKGVHVMLSNSNADLILDIYSQEPFHIDMIKAPRAVNSKANGRGAVQETLITNYLP